MFGNNPKRSSIKSDGKFLYVQDIFKTIQGECYNAGMPSIFIRLGGCNLACKFCDTEFETFQKYSIDDIINKVQEFANTNIDQKFRWLVVITGGEPFRQPIELLCDHLIRLGFRVQIETNGTLFRPMLHEEVEIICSPKVINNKYHNVREDLLQRVTAFKFLISENITGYQDISDLGQSKYDIPVYIQPMDEYDETKNQKNMNLVVKLALTNGYYLSLQIHKILGIE